MNEIKFLVQRPFLSIPLFAITSSTHLKSVQLSDRNITHCFWIKRSLNPLNASLYGWVAMLETPCRFCWNYKHLETKSTDPTFGHRCLKKNPYTAAADTIVFKYPCKIFSHKQCFFSNFCVRTIAANYSKNWALLPSQLQIKQLLKINN